ncbi:MAG: hypothetical protein CVV44_18675 [Spirochaetae bacterium HGW-Spirochaetae-1]|jgi:hypothetical protein|nr:MAG: hypothetical protein CVV44_18675 [Spirochaetae bacterium HGW-Spirochaetae-1]
MKKHSLIYLAIPAMLMITGLALMPMACGKKETMRIDCPGCPDVEKGGDCSQGLVITICSNHGHAIHDDIMKKGPESYEIRGESDHSHAIFINGGFFRELEMNRGIQLVSSSTNGHTHRITINCSKEIPAEPK